MNSILSYSVHSQNNNEHNLTSAPILYPGKPPLKAIDIKSMPIKLPSTGSIHVVSFLNRHSGDTIKLWAEYLPLIKLKNSRIQFTNIVFPGGLFFMIPKSKAMAKIRKTISNQIMRFQNDWSIEEKISYQNLKVYWTIDFKRKLFKTYGLNSKYSYLFLINSQGQLVKKLRQDDHIQMQNFLKLLLNEIERTSLIPEG